MNLKENKKLLALIITIVVLSLITLVLYLRIEIGNSNSENNSNNENKETSEKAYQTIEDAPGEILKKVYNENIDIYSTGYNSGIITENIFGNEMEKSKETYSQEYKMTIALYSFDIKNLETIKCEDIPSSENTNGYTCGGAGQDIAYKISVQDLNNKVAEIFNEDLDYSQMDSTNLYIGTCKGNQEVAIPFKYIKEQSIYVSFLSKDNCGPSKSFMINDVIKTQDKDLLTLDVYYTIKDLTEVKKHDKLYFKVKEDGSYYFHSSIMVESDIKN